MKINEQCLPCLINYANYESLSEEDKNIYFLLMVKCKVIAEYIGVKEKSLVCLKNHLEERI